MLTVILRNGDEISPFNGIIEVDGKITIYNGYHVYRTDAKEIIVRLTNEEA